MHLFFSIDRDCFWCDKPGNWQNGSQKRDENEHDTYRYVFRITQCCSRFRVNHNLFNILYLFISSLHYNFFQFDYLTEMTNEDNGLCITRSKSTFSIEITESSDCLLHGYLHKLGGPFQSQWQKKYFYLFPNRIEWRGEQIVSNLFCWIFWFISCIISISIVYYFFCYILWFFSYKSHFLIIQRRMFW